MTKNSKPKYEIVKKFNIPLSTLPTILKNNDMFYISIKMIKGL